MHILQINASYKPAYIYGGPTMSISKLSEELIKAGHNLCVFTTTANGKEELSVPAEKPAVVEGVPVYFYKRITKDHSHFSPGLLTDLIRLLKNNKLSGSTSAPFHTQLVHIHAWWNLVSVLSCLIAIFFNKPVILSPRGTLSKYSFGNKNSLYKKLFHLLLGKPLLKRCHIHVTSLREKEAVMQLFHPKTITVVPNFVQLPSALASSAEPVLRSRSPQVSVFKLLFLSRIEEKKGLDILLNALALCPLSWRLSIAGNGNKDYIETLKQQAAMLKIAQHISWIGQQGPDRKFEVMHRHDLLLLPSHDENFANVVIECLSTGTPVLVSKNVGLADYVASKGLGWVTGLDADELSICINDAFQQSEKRNEIRQKAPEIISRDFDEAHLITLYEDLYKRASNHKL